jgi:NAD+ diphosphatase
VAPRLCRVPAADGTLPGLALSTSVLDRRGDLRADPGLLPRLLADRATRVLRLVGDRVAVQPADGGGLAVLLTPPEPADAGRLALYLGDDGGTAHVGVVADDLADAVADDPGWRTLRQAGGDLDDLSASAFATTLALANWHRTHGHCPRCGAATDPVLAGWIRRCPADGSEHYPRTDMAVIMAVVDADDRILLARGKGFRGNGMSVLAGFVEPGESLAAAVAREVAEEVGIEVTDVTYLGDQPWPFPSSLMLGFTARALGTELRLQAEEIEAARWFTRDELVAAIADGSVVVSGRISISRRIIEHWFGGPLDAPELPLR